MHGCSSLKMFMLEHTTNQVTNIWHCPHCLKQSWRLHQGWKKGEEQGFTLVRRDPKANVECACMVVKPTC